MKFKKAAFSVIIIIFIAVIFPGTALSKEALNDQSQGDSGILSVISNLPNEIAKGFSDVFIAPIAKCCNNAQDDINFMMNQNLNGFRDMLIDKEENKKNRVGLNAPEYEFAKSIAVSPVIQGIADSLIVLFFFIGFCKKSLYFEMMDEMAVYKQLIKLGFAKVMTGSSFFLLNIIMLTNDKIINAVFSVTSMENNKSISISFANSDTTIDIISNIANYLKSILFLFCITVCLIICIVNLILRKIEISILASLSPLYFSTLAGESTSDVFKSFIKNFISVVMQTLFISVAYGFLINSYIASTTIGGTGGMFGGLSSIIGFIALAVYCIKAPNSVRSLLGGSSGEGIGIGEIANMTKMAFMG